MERMENMMVSIVIRFQRLLFKTTIVGMVKGQRLFRCEQGHGVVVREKSIGI
jgi:hypothetical protein